MKVTIVVERRQMSRAEYINNRSEGMIIRSPSTKEGTLYRRRGFRHMGLGFLADEPSQRTSAQPVGSSAKRHLHTKPLPKDRSSKAQHSGLELFGL